MISLSTDSLIHSAIISPFRLPSNCYIPEICDNHFSDFLIEDFGTSKCIAHFFPALKLYFDENVIHGLICDQCVLLKVVFMTFTILVVVQGFALLCSLSLYKHSKIDYSILTLISIFLLFLPLWKILLYTIHKKENRNRS